MSYVDPDKLGELMHENTLREFLLQGVFVPQIAQLIYGGLQPLLGYNLDELALIESPRLLEHYGVAENTNSPKDMGRKVLNALNELLVHYGLHIAAPPCTLTFKEAQRLVSIATPDSDDWVGPYNGGYIDGFAAAHRVKPDALIAHAKMVAAKPPRFKKKR